MKRQPPPPSKFIKYGLRWDTTINPAWQEMNMVQFGGQWKDKYGQTVGEGLFFHFKRAAQLIWDHIAWHRWLDLFVDQWLAYKYVGIMGPKSSGKTMGAALCHLLDYYCFAEKTTVIVCSDTKENLEDRIWGEIKKLHVMATRKYSWLPGHLIEGRTRIVTDDRNDDEEGRDFRNGLVGVPVKKGGQYVGISAFVGRKNERVRLCGDELSLIPKSFIDAIASLTANRNVKITGLGNPAQTTDALGVLCEPHHSLGGWDGGIDQSPKTKTWKTRFPDGICIQLPGSDCPNMDAGPGDPVPYPYLITRANMEEDAKIWGKEDWHYTMFNEGRMPRGQGSRRVITRQLCVKHRALEEPLWASPTRTKITALDAAYRAVGGDRCVFLGLEFGAERFANTPEDALLGALINQNIPADQQRQIIALVDVLVIPIQASDFESPEDQIVMFVKEQHEKRGIPPENHFLDAGMRTSLVSAYGRLWSTKVNTIDCGGRPSERSVSGNIDVPCCDYYSKFITELWWSVRLAIEAEQFRGMTEDVMMEGCAREWMTVSGNKIEVESKADMKLKTGRSPDLFDALAIGIEGARQKGFVIRRLGNPKEVVTDWKWKRELQERARKAWHDKALIHDRA